MFRSCIGEDVFMAIKLPKVSDLFHLAGKSALVTGGTGSLGSIAAQAFAGAGARVTLAGGNKEKLDEIVKEINDAGGAARGVALRPDSEENVKTLVDGTVKAQGGIDILYVASGLNKPGGAAQQTLAEFDSVLDANVRQTFLVSKAVALKMKEQGHGGKIIITSSVRGVVATNNSVAYCTSKAATDMLVKTLATEFGPAGIRVNAIAPALFRSPLTSWLYEDTDRAKTVRANIISRLPLGRLGEPDDFTGSVIFLAAPASDYINGHVLYVDGGFTID